MNKPIIGITMGDPAGIGPEIIVKALCNNEIMASCQLVILGNLNQLMEIPQAKKLPFHSIGSIEKIPQSGIPVLDPFDDNLNDIRPGEISSKAGKAAFAYIKKSIALATAKKLAAVVTGPIHKKAIKAANLDFIGHTEMFGSLTNSYDPLTVFEVLNLRIFFLTRHVSLRKACDLVTKQRILDYIKRIYHEIKRVGIGNDTIAVAGLNPHASDNGLFGSEEEEEIIPAIKAAQKKGYNVIGPIGADSVFHLARRNNWAGVLSLYHDQGHIAAKTLDFDRTISLTLGLPFLRTSVDHGTAFDIAGKGVAQSVSMEEAIKAAIKYVKK